MTTRLKATVLAPAYNEEAVIQSFLDAVLARLPDGWEILVVDDGSNDATPEILNRQTDSRVRVVTHSENRGLGAALATGFRHAVGEVVVTMDADLSHPLELLMPMVEGCEIADAVYASRYVKGGGMSGVPVFRRWISVLANWVFRILFCSRVKDLTTGYRAYRRSVVEKLNLVGTRFEAQFEITVRLITAKARIDEIPLVLVPRAAGESKMRYLRLIWRYLKMTVRMIGVRWFGRS